MKQFNWLINFAALGLLTSCGGGPAPAVNPGLNPAITPLYGSATDGVAVQQDGKELSVSFAVSGSRYLRLELGGNSQVDRLQWSGQTDKALTVATTVDTGLEIGVVPLSNAQPVQLKLAISSGACPRCTHTTEHELPAPAEFRSMPLSAGEVSLSWVDNLPGDYNFDCQVNAEDLKALIPVWGKTVDRNELDAVNQTSYWLDGNADGQIDHHDISVIRRNYGMRLGGYRLFRNAGTVAGSEPTSNVPAAEGQHRPGLPCSYSLSTSGSDGDNWRLAAIDTQGNYLGSTFAGDGTVSINVDISGVNLLPVGPGDNKFGTRVIDPIEYVDSVQTPLPAVVRGNTATLRNVPRGRLLLANILYKPSVDVTSIKSQSMSGGEPNIDNPLLATTLPFEVPRGPVELRIDARLMLYPNPGGGYSLMLITNTSADGGPATESTTVLDFTDGTLRRDSNLDGSIEDEFAFHDSDLDCISDPLAQEVQSEMPALENDKALRIAGVVKFCNLADGTMRLDHVENLGTGAELPSALSLTFAENMRLGFSAGLPELDPGERVEATIFALPGSGSEVTYWAESLHELSSNSLSQMTVTRQAAGSLKISWANPGTYSGFRLIRYSTANLHGADLPHRCVPNMTRTWTKEFGAQATGYVDTDDLLDQRSAYDLYGLRNDGALEYLGSAKGD